MIDELTTATLACEFDRMYYISKDNTYVPSYK